MARRFNGTSDFITFTMSSAVETLTAGNMTIVLVVKLNDVTDGALIHARQAGATGSTGNAWWMETFGGVWNYGTQVTARQVGTVSAADGWEVLIGRKAAGGAAAPRGRRIVLGGSTTDVTAGSTLVDGLSPGSTGTLQIGKWGTVSEFVSSDIAAAAVFASDLSDGTTATFTTYAAILAAGPAWCVAFDQANPSDPIDDDSSTGTGDSATITGTTIVADPAGFFAAGTIHNADATLTGTGIITPAPAADRAAAGSLTGTGTIASTAAVGRQTTATLTGTAGIAAAASVARAASASLTVTATIAATAAVTAPSDVTAALTGTAAITAAAVAARAAAASLTALATITAAASVTTPGTEPVKATSTDAVLAYNSSADTVLARNSSVDAVTARNSSSGGVT